MTCKASRSTVRAPPTPTRTRRRSTTRGTSMATAPSAITAPAPGGATRSAFTPPAPRRGATGPDAARGDEVGILPVFSAAGMYGPQTLNITLKVTDATGKSDTDTTTVTIVDVTPPETIITSGPPALTNQRSATITFTGTDQ